MRKKGFWIKKDGNIAVDLRLENKDRNRLAKLDGLRKNKPRIITTGLSHAKFKATIILLKRRIANEAQYKKLYKRMWRGVETKANALVKEIRVNTKRQLTLYKRDIDKLNKSKIAKRVDEEIAKRVTTLSRHKYCKFYGVISFNFIYDYCESEAMKRDLFFLLQQIGFYNIFYRKYAAHWGTNLYKLTYNIKKLKTLGYIEPFRSVNGAYVLSLKGREFISKFEKEYEAYLHRALLIKKDNGVPTLRKQIQRKKSN